MELPLTLVILTPEGEKERLACEQVNFFTMDNEQGENGGSMGIRLGHITAVAALEPNSVLKAASNGRTTAFKIAGGFAKVEDDVVTVITGAAEPV